MIFASLLLSWITVIHIIINVRNNESLMQFADRRVPWKIANGAENLVLQALQFTDGYLSQIPRRDKHKSFRI
jgi:hypothetical protein